MLFAMLKRLGIPAPFNSKALKELEGIIVSILRRTITDLPEGRWTLEWKESITSKTLLCHLDVQNPIPDEGESGHIVITIEPKGDE